MIIDFRQTEAPTDFQTDICIVGAGAAGLTLATQLDGKFRVILVEAGDRNPPRGRDDWLIGSAEGITFEGFEAGRRRSFGGATKGWFGQCLRLDPMDFEKRDWVPNSGWPISSAEVSSFYDRAETLLGLGAPKYDAQLWRAAGRPEPEFNNSDITPRFTVYCRQPDLTKTLGKPLIGQTSTITVMLNATATEIVLADNAGSVDALKIRTDGGRRGSVRAKAFVLCGGGIENPRLLLASHSVQTAGVGNAQDLVGRFFQDHPSGTSGLITTPSPRALQNQFRKFRTQGHLVWPKLALTAAAQLRWQLLNANALILCDYDETSALTTAKKAISLAKARQPVALAKHSLRLGRSLPELLLRGSHSVMTGLAPVFTAKQVLLKTHVEQVPDADNRIRLSPERDKFGQPRAQLTWRIHPYELKTMAGITQAVGAELQRLGFGTMTNAAWLDQPPSMAQAHIEDTYHHAGTTRMAATSSAGVVDPECRVFGVANLFVAGGSVFPTSGYANPTLTIVALAIRLGDTLKRHYGGERMAPPPVASSPQPALFQCERESATGCGPRA